MWQCKAIKPTNKNQIFSLLLFKKQQLIWDVIGIGAAVFVVYQLTHKITDGRSVALKRMLEPLRVGQ